MTRNGIYIATILSLWLYQPVAIPQPVQKPVMTIPKAFCISPTEMRLYKMINEYRNRYNLPAIPLSRSLCFVAATHARDLFSYPPAEPCNLHSWSSGGPWKQFCYPQDEGKKNTVWDKPRELTGYKGKGYEIVYWENNAVSVDSVMSEWRNVAFFNAFLTNTGKWKEKKWLAIGIGIYENYAIAWFGEATDPTGEPNVCGEQPRKASGDTIKPKPVPKAPSVSKLTAPVTKEGPADDPGMQVLTVPTGKYYLIVKGWITESEARRQLPGIRDNGFQAARILKQDNKIRISVYETMSKNDADSTLRVIRTRYRDAWILKY